MKKASVLTALFVLIVVASPQSLPTRINQGAVAPGLPAKAHYIFRVPVFAGTELFNSNSDLGELSPPFATSVQVFRTTDGRSLDKQSVIAFYRDALAHNGWMEAISNRHEDNAYLSMRTDVFEDLADGSRIQIAGDLSVWVAPLDGMITVYLHQWRISSTDQVTHNSVQAMVGRLIRAAGSAGYRAQKVYSDGRWRADFENEYLVDRVLYGLVPADAQPSMDAPPGTLIVTLLIYHDANVAAEEKARRERDQRSLCAGIKGKIVLTVEGESTKEKCASVLTSTTMP